MMKFLGIIPARYASTRFAGKPLAAIGGHPMIEWVYRRARRDVEQVCVATDDERICNCVRSFGGDAVMTSPNHATGTDRIAEAARLLGSDADVIINIQGDEPFIDPQSIVLLMRCFDDARTHIATLARPVAAGTPYAELADPNVPKVLLSPSGQALAFSRQPIPYVRGVDKDAWTQHHTFYRHIGIYAYRAAMLQAITRMAQTPLEKAESLEQLRWIENGLHISVAVTQADNFGIDTPADLQQACRLAAEGKFML